jgi:hypothetical protein
MPHLTFARASQNVPAPPTDGVGKAYHHLKKDILGIAAKQQAESSLQRWAKVFILSLGDSKASRERTAMEHPTAGTVSSSARHSACGGVKGHALSIVHTTCVVASTVIENGTALAPRCQGLKHLGAMCMTCASLRVFGRPTTLSNVMAKAIPAFGWRTTASGAGWAGGTTNSSSSSFSSFTLLTCPKLGSTTCLET